MRAAIFEQAGQALSIREVTTPTPGPGQLLLKVRYCGICGSDLHMTDSASCYNCPSGSIIGHEFTGEIVALGEGTELVWKEGDRVTALPYLGCGHCLSCLAGDPCSCAQVKSKPNGTSSGGFAEYTVVGAAETIRLPAQFSWEEGALVEPVAVGVHAVSRAAMPPGARVLVVGAGPVGLAVAACARAIGAGTVVVTARSTSNADLARAMGATEFLLNDGSLPEQFTRFAGGPPEIIFECVGLPGMFNFCAELAARRGKVIMAGACLQREDTLPIVATMKELSFDFVVSYTRRDFEVAIAMIASARVEPLQLLTATTGLAEFPAIFEGLRRRSTHCKVLLSPGT